MCSRIYFRQGNASTHVVIMHCLVTAKKKVLINKLSYADMPVLAEYMQQEPLKRDFLSKGERVLQTACMHTLDNLHE